LKENRRRAELVTDDVDEDEIERLAMIARAPQHDDEDLRV
jgi:hypothetical protein